MLLPLTNAQRTERFGSFRFVGAPRPSNPEAIRVVDGWVDANIAAVFCPQLERLFGVEAVRLHRKAVEAFLELWRVWEEERLLDRVHSWDGALALRYKRGRAGGGFAALSNHALGTAFDICAKEYPLGRVVAANAPIRALFPAAERMGWFCGANFRSRPDGMHFEYTGVPYSKEHAARMLLAGEKSRALVAAAQRLIGAAQDGSPGPKTLARARAVLGGA